MMVDKEKLLEFLRKNGPSVPSAMMKEIPGGTLLISSILSELNHEGKVKITSVKYGSSPFYYIPDHLSRIEPFSKYLNEKDQKTFEKLRGNKILRDNALSPLEKVSIRQIKDFAVPLKVNIKGSQEIVWKYFLTSSDEAIDILKKQVNGTESKRPEEISQNSRISPEKEEKTNQAKVRSSDDQKDQKDTKKDENKESDMDTKKDEGKGENKGLKRDDTQSTLSQAAKKEGFLGDVLEKFEKMGIVVVDHNVIRKNSEIDLTLQVPTPVGKMKFYCKAKSKKRVNDGDLSSAFFTGESKKLPVLFLTNGKLTKKAESMKTEFKNNFTVMRL